MTRFTGLLLVVLCTTAHGAPPKISWSAVDDLVDNGQLEAASEIAGKLREKARASGSEADWAKALVKEVQLRQALAG